MTVPAYEFAPSERPLFPGSPFSPHHSVQRRVLYAAMAVLTGVTTTFCNALVTVNVPNLSGELGTYLVQTSWLPAIYVAMNATANLTLVRARTQFGIPAITHGLLIAYICCGLLQFIVPGFATAVLIRAVNGVTAAGLTTLTIYYLLQIFPPKLRPLGLVIGICLPQLGVPLARLVPVEFLTMNGWQGLHLIEVTLGMTILAAMKALPLPPSECSRAFEPLDFVTILLTIAGMLLLCGVLGLGRVVWWTDTPWLGWMLAASIPLLAAALYIEHRRRNPLLNLRWIGSSDILRFAVVALLVRLALAEQTYGAVGLLTSGGLNNDQLHILFVIVAISMLLGMTTACLTLSERRIPFQVMVAALIIAAGAWLDSDATNITRPPQLYLSQALLGFGTTLFIGPALVYGFLRVLSQGPAFLVSFIVLFSTTQNVGGLAGSALLGSYQVIATKAHYAALTEDITAADPQVMARIQAGSGAVSGAVVDPGLRSFEGGQLLGQATLNEATILAYNDVFRLVAILALLTAAYIAYLIIDYWLRRGRAASGVPAA